MTLQADRVAVIGDVGGHLAALRLELSRLGASSSGRLPDGLTVVQVGDLIHRGPDSAGVVALVDRYLTEQPGQWIQLVGNHEAQYLREPAFDWPEKLLPSSVETLRRWWDSGQMVAAVALSSPAERFLVTHAGLTRGFWLKVLSGVEDASLAAAALNSFIGTHEDVLFHAGQMLGGGRPDVLAGPVWASAATELVPSWLGVPLPFSQVHGHARLAAHPRGRRSKGADLSQFTTVDAESQHETTTLEGGRIIGVDPGHAKQSRTSWRAFTVNGPTTCQI